MIEIFIDMECTHCGDEVKAEYNTYFQTIKVDPCDCQAAIQDDKYDEGFEAGKEQGYKDGYDEGLDSGHENGYNDALDEIEKAA